MNPPAVTRHLVVRGLVQGVGYRWSMVQAAQRLGVRGWVRNRRDGSVEALAFGPAVAVDALTAWARNGPDGAQVSALDVAEVPAPAEPPSDFVQRGTA
ncbi:acylphosphatase [Variovorax sp. OV700]|jgi:acylphosphatase|uniref:acylphosphatase n=1 Tax=Variovorax sp. OV700 TaxID=1882826 RepID=UPI00087E16EA|nr:acylphosphatase [Variovorax sp. OV700]SDI27463.1 acylphosphatase [Variovorax sp. OV700]